MAAFIVPHNVGTRTVTLWVAWWDGGIRPVLELVIRTLEGSEVERRPLGGGEGWKTIGRSGNAPVCRYKTERITGLEINRAYRVQLVQPATGQIHTTAFFETLPSRLLSPAETGNIRDNRPFTIMLGSCFWDGSDNFEAAGTYRVEYLNHPRAPHIKLLVGDQVYVDQPPQAWADANMSSSEIRSLITERYHAAWHKLKPLLEHGANFCTTDDHEYWNDYPFKPLPIWVAHQRSAKRRRIGLEARQFAKEIQLASTTPRRFVIGADLDVFIPETRLGRTETTLMSENNLRAIEIWIRQLATPGVLVLGQPLLWSPVGSVLQHGDRVDWGLTAGVLFLGPVVVGAGGAIGTAVGGGAGAAAGGTAGSVAVGGASVAGVFAHLLDDDGVIADHNLMYFKGQYRRLVSALSRSNHDVLVLTGDIHTGRIARMKIHRKNGSDPTKVYEVAASPLSLLDTGPEPRQNTHHPLNNPFFFPPDPRLTDSTVMTSVVDYVRHIPPADGDRSLDHFMTLAFTKGPEPGSVRVQVQVFRIGSGLDFLESFILDAGRLPQDGSVPQRRVSQVVKNTDGDITALAHIGQTWSPRLLHEAIRDIEAGLASYYVHGGPRKRKVWIHVVNDRSRGIKYLRTNRDDDPSTNLDNLRALRIRDWH